VGILMQPFDPNRRRFLTVLASSGVLFLPSICGAGSEPIAVVMGRTSTQRGLSLDKLRRIFLASPTEGDDGRRFVPLNLGRRTPAREAFDRRVLGMNPEEVARFWIDQRLRGKKPPQTVSSLATLRRALDELPGTISYLPLSAIESLHLVAIDGRMPTDPGYPIR
jgi:hypothetical protein